MSGEKTEGWVLEFLQNEIIAGAGAELALPGSCPYRPLHNARVIRSADSRESNIRVLSRPLYTADETRITWS